MSTRSAFFLGFSLTIGAAASAQPLSYSLLRADGAQPSPRLDGTIAYDPGARAIYLFGGSDTASRNDLWRYSLAERRWEEVQAGAAPPARFGHTLLFDALRRRLVVFGGQSAGFFSDVWAFDIDARAWRQLGADDAGPRRRYGHSAIYDAARDRMVVSHGFTNSGRFDDTWAFDFASNAWRNLTPSGTRPLPRCLHHAVYDGAAGQMHLFGGCASGFGPCPLADLWSFDLAANRWTERTPALKPPPRQHYGMGFDAVRGRVVVFGGSGAGLLSDTWEFDPRAGAWRQPAVAGDVPGPRHRHESAYASDRGTIYFFGGITAAGASNELWMLGPGFATSGPQVVRDRVVNAFSGAGGAVSPGEILSIFGDGLGPLNGISFAFDELTGRLPESGPGVTVTFNGVAAPLYFARSDQLNVQAPYELAGQAEARLVVTVNGQSSEPVTLPVAATSPGLFPRIWNQDGTANAADNPAPAGSVVVLYATGHGVTNPAARSGAVARDVYPEPAAAVALRVEGREAEVLFRGAAPGTAGVMQINARVPVGVTGSPAVTLLVGSGESHPVVLWVR